MNYSIDIASDVSRHGITLSCALASVNVNQDHDLTPLMEELTAKLSTSKETLKDHPAVRALRDFYWRIGIDPTKTRPASEAFARRFLTGSMPKINNVVDAGNIASIETLVPIGIYDADRIAGRVVLRLAVAKEEFTDISNQKHELHGMEIVLSDSHGIIHVFPHRDSLRTAVTEQTKNVLVVGCGVPGMETALVKAAVDRTIELMQVLGK